MNKKAKLQKAPDTWAELQTKFYSLRPIRNTKDHNKALNAAGFLAGHDDLNTDQQDYLESLSAIIVAYENQHYNL